MDKLNLSSSPAPKMAPGENIQPPRMFYSLGFKIPAILVGLLGLAFLITTFISAQTSRSALLEQLKEDLSAQVELQAELLESHLLETRSMAVDLAAIAHLARTPDDSRSLIRSILKNNEQVFGSTIAYEPYAFQPDLYYWSPFYSRGPEGSLNFTQLGTPEYDYFSWEWYTLPKEQEKTILSPPYFDEGGGNIWMVTWSAPFFDAQGNFQGVATADIAFSQTQEIVRQITVGEQGYAFLIDREGILLGIGEQGADYQIMVDSMIHAPPQNQDANWVNLMNAMAQGDSGFVYAIDPMGQPVFVAYHPVGLETGWSIGLAFHQDELFQPVNNLVNSLVISASLLAIVFIVIAFLFSQTITRPLQALTLYASRFWQERLQKGRAIAPIEIRTQDELENLANSFNQVSRELVNTLENLEEKVTERTKALQISYDVSRRLSNILNPQTLAREVVEQVHAAFGYYHAHIYFFDEQNENLVMMGGTGEAGEAMLASGHKIPRGRGLVGRAAESGQPVLVPDVSQSIGWLPNPLLPETKAEAAVPISAGGQVLGVLDVQENSIGGLDEDDIGLLQSLASQVAISLQNARAYERSRAQAEVEALANIIGQKIQRAATVEETLQIAVREVGLAVGAARAVGALEAPAQHENREN